MVALINIINNFKKMNKSKFYNIHNVCFNLKKK